VAFVSSVLFIVAPVAHAGRLARTLGPARHPAPPADAVPLLAHNPSSVAGRPSSQDGLPAVPNFNHAEKVAASRFPHIANAKLVRVWFALFLSRPTKRAGSTKVNHFFLSGHQGLIQALISKPLNQR